MYLAGSKVCNITVNVTNDVTSDAVRASWLIDVQEPVRNVSFVTINSCTCVMCVMRVSWGEVPRVEVDVWFHLGSPGAPGSETYLPGLCLVVCYQNNNALLSEDSSLCKCTASHATTLCCSCSSCSSCRYSDDEPVSSPRDSAAPWKPRVLHVVLWRRRIRQLDGQHDGAHVPARWRLHRHSLLLQ